MRDIKHLQSNSNKLAQTNKEKGFQIAMEAYHKNKGFLTQSSDIELILMNAQGSKINRKMHSKSIEVNNDGDRVLIEFLWPSDVKGTKLLTWSHKEKSDDQ